MPPRRGTLWAAPAPIWWPADEAIHHIMDTVETPDRMAENLVMFIRQYNGTLSKDRRDEKFKELRDDEVASLEIIVRDAFEGFADAAPADPEARHAPVLTSRPGAPDDTSPTAPLYLHNPYRRRRGTQSVSIQLANPDHS